MKTNQMNCGDPARQLRRMLITFVAIATVAAGFFVKAVVTGELTW